MELLRDHVALLVTVDILSFSTAADIAVSRGRLMERAHFVFGTGPSIYL